MSLQYYSIIPSNSIDNHYEAIANGEEFEDIDYILEGCSGDVFELGKDYLPKWINDIRGMIYNEPQRVFAESVKTIADGLKIYYFGVSEIKKSGEKEMFDENNDLPTQLKDEVFKLIEEFPKEGLELIIGNIFKDMYENELYKGNFSTVKEFIEKKVLPEIDKIKDGHSKTVSLSHLETEKEPVEEVEEKVKPGIEKRLGFIEGHLYNVQIKDNNIKQALCVPIDTNQKEFILLFDVEKQHYTTDGGGHFLILDECNEFDIMMNVYKEKKHRENLKKFNKGMTFFNNGYDRPRHDFSEQLGWDAAKEMKEVKVKYLKLMEQAYTEKLS